MVRSVDDIVDYISNSKQVRDLHQLALNRGFWPDFPYVQIEKFDAYLSAVGINQLTKVDDLIEQNFLKIGEYLKEIYSHRRAGWSWRLNTVFLCELVLIHKFPEILNLDFLKKMAWDEEIANIVLTAAKKYA